MLEVIPAINCADESCAATKLSIAVTLPASWLHVDVSDGTFAPTATWSARAPQDFFAMLRAHYGTHPLPSLEAHLMVDNPRAYAELWFDAGAKRVIAHVETLDSFDELEALAQKHGGEIIVAALYQTPLDEIIPHITSSRGVHILTVPPGFSGNALDSRAIELIRALREKFPRGMIEVDGGINARTVFDVRDAGASVVVSDSYLFASGTPREAFDKLRSKVV